MNRYLKNWTCFKIRESINHHLIFLSNSNIFFEPQLPLHPSTSQATLHSLIIENPPLRSIQIFGLHYKLCLNAPNFLKLGQAFWAMLAMSYGIPLPRHSRLQQAKQLKDLFGEVKFGPIASRLPFWYCLFKLLWRLS